MRQLLNTRVCLILAVCGTLVGCVSEDPELEGVSLSGGNAIAHNSALQIIDPWPANVHDTDIETNPSHADGGSSTGGTATTPAPTAEPAPVAND